VRASYLQIYNEVISDLLKPERTNLSIREDKKKGVYVEGLSEWVVRSPKEVYGATFRPELVWFSLLTACFRRPDQARLVDSSDGLDAHERDQQSQPRVLHHHC
jgi:hypothetical protein